MNGGKAEGANSKEDYSKNFYWQMPETERPETEQKMKGSEIEIGLQTGKKPKPQGGGPKGVKMPVVEARHQTVGDQLSRTNRRAGSRRRKPLEE